MAIVGRAVPLSLQTKNREKARERIYFPVCLPLTHRVGTGLKGLRVMSRKYRSAKISTLYFWQTFWVCFLFCLQQLEKPMLSTIAASTLAGLWVLAGTAMLTSLKID